MSDDIVHQVADLPKNGREVLRVSLQTFKGQKLLAARVWATGDSGEVPTKKGINVRIEQAKPFLDALTRALEKAHELGWIEGAAP
jgi:hypothetical protein